MDAETLGRARARITAMRITARRTAVIPGMGEPGAQTQWLIDLGLTTGTDVPALADVAEAAARWASESILVGQPWWWDGDLCLGCGVDALSWEIVAHDEGCPALALDAALARLAGPESESAP